jgi:ATP-dependent Lon protease
METNIAARLEEATGLLESILKRLDEREESVAGNVERISATVEQSRREIELAERLMNVEKELTTLKASSAASVMSSLRRTIPSAAAEMLTKYGAGDGPVDVRTLDQALNGLSLEQRIAVKSQLLRSGAIAQ